MYMANLECFGNEYYLLYTVDMLKMFFFILKELEVKDKHDLSQDLDRILWFCGTSTTDALGLALVASPAEGECEVMDAKIYHEAD